tara:strand:+ start:403 stop:837 length:435 start_codon:yes stop_codon:yes gene_type:complete
MNISDCSNEILSWFRENESVFSLKKAKEILEPIVEDTEEREALIRGSLNFLEECKLIEKVSIESRDFWILKKRIEAYSQTVEINETLAMGIAKEINEFCEVINDHSDRCSSADIREKDIKNLLIMYVHAKTALAKKEIEEDDEL